jgi:ERF superfamily
MKVYQAINAVQAELCKIGIAKSSTNTQGAGYKFRGIDAVYNVLSSIMAQNGLVIVPRMLGRTCEERTSKSGGALFYVTVEAEFDLVSAEDGSKHTARTFGEAMDSGDKATNKAMSAAYKYMAFQTFAIPTEGDNDADAHTHEVARKKPSIENSRLTQAIQKIKEGAYTTDKLRETFALTAEQEKVLVGALAND